MFSLFLETLLDLIAVHKQDLRDWLYVLLTRLLNKTGADMLGSVHGKVQRALETLRSVSLSVGGGGVLYCMGTSHQYSRRGVKN